MPSEEPQSPPLPTPSAAPMRSSSTPPRPMSDPLPRQPKSAPPPTFRNSLASKTTLLSTLTTPGINPSQVTLTKHPLGRGSFGSVWRGTFAGSPVAIKICSLTPRNDTKESRAAIQHFRRETARYYHLRHPCIVQFFCVVHHAPSNNLLLVTELMKGGSLYHTLERLRHAGAKSLPLSALLRIATHIANGLAYLHASNFSFGDLKSMNVLLSEPPDLKRLTTTPTTQAKLCDFGLSRNLDRLMPSETHVPARNGPAGTFAYLAPEAFSGLPVDDTAAPRAADVYALAIVLWELATLRPPWPQKQPLQLFRLVVKEGARPPWPRRHDLPAGLIRLVETCWQQDASKRPSAEHVASGLATLLDAFGDAPTSPVVQASSFTKSSISSLDSQQALRLAFGVDLLADYQTEGRCEVADSNDVEGDAEDENEEGQHDSIFNTAKGDFDDLADSLVDAVITVDDDATDTKTMYESFVFSKMVDTIDNTIIGDATAAADDDDDDDDDDEDAELDSLPQISIGKAVQLPDDDNCEIDKSDVVDVHGMITMGNAIHMTTSSVESSQAGSTSSSAARLRKYCIPAASSGLEEELDALERENEVGVDSTGVCMFTRPHFR